MRLFGLLLPPWLLPALGAVALAGAFWGGWQVQGWRCAAKQAGALREAQERFRAQLEKQHSEAEKYERDREASRAESRGRQDRIREIYRTVEVPAECAAPDGVRSLLNDAVERANSRARGESGSAVPPSAEPASAAE